MEMRIASIAMSVVVVTMVTWALRVIYCAWWKPKQLESYLRQQGLSGNSYRLFHGDSEDFLKAMKEAKSKPVGVSDDISLRLMPFVHQTVKKYGKDSFIWLETKPRVNIMNPEHIKEVLNRINDFKKPKANPVFKVVSTGISYHEGEKWTKHRRILNPAFHPDKLKAMLTKFCESSNVMLKNWEKSVSTAAPCEMDVWPYLQNLTSDVISRTAFGSNYEEGRRIFVLQKELAKLAVQALYGMIPGRSFNKKMKEMDREIKASLMDIIKKREEAMKVGEAVKDDLLGLLMESNYREMQEHDNNKKAGMSIQEVIGECKLFYFAGQETTSVLLAWSMVLLSEHQHWQERAREEVLHALGDHPKYDELSRLKIVQMILYEVLRLYAPVIGMARTVEKEMKLGNLTIPAGVEVYIPTLLVHRDQELWGDDAMEFKPERFAEGVSKATNFRLSYLPFGWGPRICIGQNFALLEAKLALAMILRSFKFELSPSYIHSPHSVISLQPQHGVQMILQKV